MTKIPVIAGTGAFKVEYALETDPQLVNLYVTAYSMGFMTDPRLVISIPPVGCNISNCSETTSVFLPGSLDLVRLDNGYENASLFSDPLPGNTVVIGQAPGYQVEYSTVDSNFEFQERDCSMFMKSMSDGLYIFTANIGY
jgi:hypothetical protein